jgi:hypothetical protein
MKWEDASGRTVAEQPTPLRQRLDDLRPLTQSNCTPTR